MQNIRELVGTSSLCRYTEKKQDEECVKQNRDFYNMNVHVSKLVEMKMMDETIRSMKSSMGIETQVIEK